MRLLDFVKWAAGDLRGPKLPAVIEIEATVEDFSAAVARCHLSSRAYLKLQDPNAPNVAPAFRQSLERLHEQAQQISLRNLRETALLQNHIETTPPILIKGPTAWLASGGTIPLRRSRNIDVVVDGMPEAGVLKALGYEKSASLLAPHAIANLVKPSDEVSQAEPVFIIAQRYFPIVGFPDLQAVDLHHPGRNYLGAYGDLGRVERAIEYRELALETYVSQGTFGEIRILRAEAAAIISCAHMLKRQLSRSWSDQFGSIRLGELADLVDLTGVPGFDVDRFVHLCDAWEAGDAVAYAGSLAETYLGRSVNILKAFAAPDSVWRYRRIGGVGTRPIVVRATSDLHDPGDLLVRSRPMAEVVEQFRPEVIHLPAEPGAVRQVALGSSAARSFTQGSVVDFATVEASFEWRTSSLSISLRSPRSTEPVHEFIRLDFGDTCIEVAKTMAGAGIEIKNWGITGSWVEDCVRAVWTMTADSSTVELDVPWKVIPQLVEESEAVSFFLGYDRGYADNEHSFAAAVPVHMTRARVQNHVRSS